MKSFKLKVLTAAIGIAVTGFSGMANAAIANAASGNGELYLTVWDQTGLRSYTRDLGLTVGGFGTQNAPASGGFTSVVDLTTSPVLNLASDANWSAFVSAQTPSNVGAYQWAVTGWDGQGTGATGQLRALYSSKTDDQARAADPSSNLLQNSKLSALIINQDQMINALNGTDTNFSLNNSYIITDATSPAYAGFLSGLFGAQAPNLSPFALVGESTNFMYATRSGTGSTPEALFTKYGNIGGPSQFQFSANGVLTFTPPGVTPPIPEPGEWAMLLAGLAVVGSIARRRLSSHV